MASRPRAPRKSRVMIVDDHPVIVDGLSSMIEEEPDLIVCGGFRDAASALKNMPLLKPDIAVVDVTLEGMNGLDLTKNLRARWTDLRILIFSLHKEFLYAERVLRAGANGYVMKSESRETILKAIREVLRGGTYVSDAVKDLIVQTVTTAHPANPIALVDQLSDREFEVFQLIARGYGTRPIAENLNLSMKTVETHREHIREKLHLQNTFELVQYALEWSSQGSSPRIT